MFGVIQATIAHPELVLLVTQEVVLTGVTMVPGNISQILVVRRLMLLAQPVLTIIVIGAVEVIIVMQEAAFLVTPAAVLTDATMGLGIMYLIAVHPLLLILHVPLVLITTVFGAIGHMEAILGLAVPGIQEAVLTGVMMVLGIMYLIAVHPLPLILHVPLVLIAIVFGAIGHMEAILGLAVPGIQEAVLTGVMMVLGIMYLIAVHPLPLILHVPLVLIAIVFGVIQAIMAILGLVLLDILEAVLTDVTMDHGSLNLILVVCLRHRNNVVYHHGPIGPLSIMHAEN